MAFQPPISGLPRNVAIGDKVQFEFVMPKDGEPTLTDIRPITPAPASVPPKAAPANGAAR